MSTSTINQVVSPSTEAQDQRGASIHRSAFYLPGRGEPVFAWLHRQAQQPLLDHGVLICPPIGHEQLHSHRSLRFLADQLAEHAIPIVRFDWHGTGDSPGQDEDPKRIATWLANICDAVTWMREQLGCQKITLVGLRLGATLATAASNYCQVENLVLWSPITKGRTYLRELKALGLTSDAPARSTDGSSRDIEAGGFLVNEETAQELNGVDLIQYHPECRQVLVVSRSGHHDDDRICHHWAMLGLRVQQISVHGYVEMMAEPHRSQIPHHAIQQITDWLTQSVSENPRKLPPREILPRQHTLTFPSRSITNDDAVQGPDLHESTWWISKNPPLFGIVTEPQRPNVNDKPTVVLLNAGTAHRVAPGRLNTHLARRLASAGFRCMRMDLGGLGDSAQELDENENHSYPATTFRDIDLALRQIQDQFGATRIVLMGLCSGAYSAFQAAAQIQNPALVESILINPLTYFWKEGMSLDASPTKHLMSFHYYAQRALNPLSWFRLLTGKSRLGLKGAFKILAQRFGWIKQPYQRHPSPQANPPLIEVLSHPTKEDTVGDLRRIVGFNRQLSLFFSTSDPGYSILNYHAKRKVRQLRKQGKLNVSFIENADHIFSRKAARNDLIDAIATHLTQTYSSMNESRVQSTK